MPPRLARSSTKRATTELAAQLAAAADHPPRFARIAAAERQESLDRLVADLLELLIYVGPYIYGFWAYIFSADFRSKVHDEWRARSGWRHIRTAFEIVIATIFGLAVLVGPFALVGLLFL